MTTDRAPVFSNAPRPVPEFFQMQNLPGKLQAALRGNLSQLCAGVSYQISAGDNVTVYREGAETLYAALAELQSGYPENGMLAHNRGRYEMIVALSGQAEITINKQIYQVQPGVPYVINDGDRYSLRGTARLLVIVHDSPSAETKIETLQVKPIAPANGVLRPCTAEDLETIREIINDAAMAYRGVVPAQIYREPWMTAEQLQQELAAGVKFVGFERQGQLQGVMGVQDIEDVTLIRHSYVRTTERGHGIGDRLIENHLAECQRPMLVGCLKAMTWAIRFYEEHGFRLVSEQERDKLRAKYWKLSAEHVVNSVVLTDRY